MNYCEQQVDCRLRFNHLYDCENNRCIRQSFDNGYSELTGYVVLLAIAAITNSGGVGAAAIVVPALIQLFSFVSSDAIHLSRLTIFAGAFVNVAINWRKRDA